MQLNNLSSNTLTLLQKISMLECVKPYVLVGGSALSIQLGTRHSEDLDFMSWKSTKKDKCDVNWPSIEKELKTIGTIEDINIKDFDLVEFIVDGVKISFYACDKYSPLENAIHVIDNIYIADVEAIGVMKMEVMQRRSNFRDYYDIYAILRSGVDIETLIPKALSYSQHRMRTKNLLSILTNSSRFQKDSSFQQLMPLYDVTPQDIEDYIKSKLKP